PIVIVSDGLACGAIAMRRDSRYPGTPHRCGGVADPGSPHRTASRHREKPSMAESAFTFDHLHLRSPDPAATARFYV
ncbi:hypothetical protein, partial [Serratia marcescens]|uniref:hypothetical protein n=1 Tax=Serratia marcescens TaxID=615 RepID=UPI001954455F